MNSQEDLDRLEKPGRKRFGCLLTSLCCLAVLALVGGSGYFIWYSNARSDLDAEIAWIMERGEPLWFSDLEPEPIDPDENGVDLYVQALTKMQAPTQGFINALATASPVSLSEDPVIVAELARNREVLDLLAQAMQKPYFRMPRDYRTHKPFSLDLGDLQEARNLTLFLEGDAKTAIALGDHARAVEVIDRMFGLAELLRVEPITITQLTRIAIISMAQSTTEMAVAHMDLSPDEFATLDKRLATIGEQFTVAPVIRTERASAFTTLEHLAENTDVFTQEQPDISGSLSFMGSRFMRPSLMADEAFMLRTMSAYLEVIDKDGPEGLDAILEIEARVGNAPKTYVFSRMLMPALKPLHGTGLRTRMKLITARLGIRLDRYFAEHGKFPASLAEITDERLPTVPVDLYSGKPLIYKIMPDGFVIYPVGENGIDDGGGMKPDHIEVFSHFEVHYPPLATPAETSNDSPNP